jgi:hypothetical protein
VGGKPWPHSRVQSFAVRLHTYTAITGSRRSKAQLEYEDSAL